MTKKQTALEKAEVTTEVAANTGTSLLEFSKEQLVKSRRYVHRRDALNALLEGDRVYSFAQVEEILKNFDKGGLQ